MRKPITAKAVPAAADLRKRAARARDAANRFDVRVASVEKRDAVPDPALAVATVFRASWDALATVLDAEAPDELVAELNDAQSAAYQRLKTVRPTTPAGYRALAEAWSVVLKGERGDEPAVMAADHAADSLMAGAGVCVPDQPIDHSILGQIDLAAAGVEELRIVIESMRDMASVAHGMTALGCCTGNTAGNLMAWLADELTAVESKAADELQRRQPTDFWDRRSRLGAIAERIIQNGDDDETATFIRELTAWAAEQAER